MVSLPTYDPNRLAAHDLGGGRRGVRRAADATRAEPLLNRAIQTRLPPARPSRSSPPPRRSRTGNYDGRRVAGARRTDATSLPADAPAVIDNGGRDCGTGKITLTQALENSCNTTFLALADELGDEKMLEQAEAFGFNSDYLDDLGPQARARSSPTTWTGPRPRMPGIGQFEVAATPLQMAMVAAGIANGGMVMKPYLVDEVHSPDLDVLDKTEPEPSSREAISPATASELTKMMVAGRRRTAPAPRAIPGVEVAGKTGTAENGDGLHATTPGSSPSRPANDPKVAVAVMIQGADIPRRRDRRRRARRPDRQGRHGGGDQPVSHSSHPSEGRGLMTNPEPTVIGGRYELGELLGRGGMAEVRKGTDLRLGRGRSRSSGCAPTWPATRRSRPGSAARRSPRPRSTTPRSSRSTTPARRCRPTAPTSPSPTS